jgi:hypothetical protein
MALIHDSADQRRSLHCGFFGHFLLAYSVGKRVKRGPGEDREIDFAAVRYLKEKA